ncbi:iron export ABC transporter permease subunit FetB [bacterium]|nr:iron export ABC transporter permease subunit FetB [bacterium]
MQASFTDITWVGLAWSLLLIAVVMIVSRWQGLGLEQKLLIGCIRTVVQLLAIGFILGWIIQSSDWRLVLLASLFQLLAATWIVGTLVAPRLPGVRLIALTALAPAYLFVLAMLLFVVIRPDPWWDARLVLPLGGMLLGNSVTGIALALNRYRSDLRLNRELVLARLALGATWRQAVEEERNNAAHAAILPTVAALLTVGIVALPGMMTGQIIAGSHPLAAVKYQIVVMFMISAAVALAATISLVMIVRRERFEPEAQPRPKPAH